MKEKVSVRLDKSHQEKLIFLYKLYRIENQKDSDSFRKLLDAIYSEKINPSDTSILSTTQLEELELLDDWDCSFRAIVYRFDNFSKIKEPLIHCSATDTRRILGTNIIDISICKKCHDRGASSNFIAIPAPKKPEKPQPTSKSQPVQKQERKCVDCGCDISRLEIWMLRCKSCWIKKQNPAWQSDTKPLAGSPLDLRMKEAEATRRAHEEMNEQNDTKTEE